jgi:predicted MFS family arabinose efflux permease
VVDRAAPTRGYARYVLAILTVVYVFNFIDRQILSILMEPIRLDLHLSDSELGLLSGLSFALFYASFGVPIARLADKTSRRNIIVVCLAAWSVMTAVCGFAQSFVQLLLARIGVSVGEAGASPSSHSMIADLFPHGRRSTALAIYATGIPIGTLIGLSVGGLINQAFNWRVAFMVVGLPGLIAAALVALTIREPVRAGAAAGSVHSGALRELWAISSYRRLTLAASLHAFTAYAALQWNPAFLIRIHGMRTGQVGLWLGLIVGVTGTIGTLGGGYLADRLGRRDARWYAWLPALTIGCGIPFYLAAYLASGASSALLLLIVPALCANCFTGPVFGAVQSLAPLRTRALAAAVLLFIISVVGLGLGPLTVGIVSDLLKSKLGRDSLRWAMCSAAIAELAAIVVFLRAASSLRRDLAMANAREATP